MQNTPENDKIIQKQIFTINISGENSIDIHSLSKLLSNIDTLTTIASPKDASCKFNIVAVNKGSFELVLEGIAQFAMTMVTPDNVNYVLSCLETINEWFAIKKHLGFGSPKSIEKNEKEIRITNEKGETNVFSPSGSKFFENTTINNCIINIGSTLKDSQRGQFKISEINNTSPNPILSISSQDYDELSTKIDVRNKDTVYVSHTIAELLLVTAVCNGNSKWGFYFNKKIKATIEDEAWLYSFQESKVNLTYGTRMTVQMRIETLRDDNGNPIEKTAKYFIEKILSIVYPFDDSYEQIEFK